MCRDGGAVGFLIESKTGLAAFLLLGRTMKRIIADNAVFGL